MRYQELASDLPPEPPLYEDDVDSLDLERADGIAEELHEIEQMDYEDPTQQTSRLSKLKIQFNLKIKEPIIDPLIELYLFLCVKFDLYLAKLGNPLIVKRLAYIIFISIVVYLLSFTGVFPDGSGYYNNYGSGFSDRASLLEFSDKSINLKRMEENLEYISSMNHVSGTKGDLTLAQFVETNFRQSSLNVVDFQELRTLLNFPNKTTLKYDDVELDLTEQFMPLSIDGEVTGNLIYAGFGRVKDYELLKKANVQVEENIAIIKFDNIYPVSQKILIAQSYNIKAILFISSNEKFPDSFERRSAEITQSYAGDPLTPGWSTSTVKNRVDLQDSSIAKIPTVSLTRNQIKPLLAKLSDKGTKLDDFNTGDGSSIEVTLTNRVVFQEDHSIWNVLGRFDGKEQKDKALIIGASRDAACRGAIYPNAGTVLLLELVELFTRLQINFNWSPLRSIYFISFDASEYNYAGVTELIEAKLGEIKREAIAYIDLNDIVSGDSLEVRANGLLNLDQYKDEFNFTLKHADSFGNFIPFMAEGVPVMELGYKLKDGYTPKYTCQDDFNWFKSNVDGDFEKMSKLTKLVIRIALDLVEDPLLPFDLIHYASSLDKSLRDLEKYITQKRSNIKPNYNPIIEPLLRIKQMGQEFQTWKKAWNDLIDENTGLEPSLLSVHRWNYNIRLTRLEKVFCDQEALPGRKWFKNLITSPQLFKPEEGDFDWFSFPSIRDAVDYSDDESIQREIDRVGRVLSDGIRYILE